MARGACPPPPRGRCLHAGLHQEHSLVARGRGGVLHRGHGLQRAAADRPRAETDPRTEVGFSVFSRMEARDQSGKTANRREEGNALDRQRTAGDERARWGSAARGAAENGEAGGKTPARRRRRRCARRALRARGPGRGRGARGARHDDAFSTLFVLAGEAAPRVDATGGEDHAPQVPSAKPRRPDWAATLALIVKMPRASSDRGRRGSFLREARWARSRKSTLPPPDKADDRTQGTTVCEKRHTPFPTFQGLGLEKIG